MRLPTVVKGRHLTTKHEPKSGLNDVNPGLYWKVLCFGWGYYRNSHTTRDRVLVSYWYSLAFDWNGVTYAIGFVTGYPDQPILPYFTFSWKLAVKNRNFRLFFIPRTCLNSSAIHASIEQEVPFSELLSTWKNGLFNTVNRLGRIKRKVVPLVPDKVTEFRDSVVADFVNFEAINDL